MEEKIYYTKIIFESIGCRSDWNILLNVGAREVAFESLKWIGGKEKVVENVAEKLIDDDIDKFITLYQRLRIGTLSLCG